MFPTRARFNTDAVKAGLCYIETFLRRGYEHPFLADGWMEYFFWRGKSAMSFVDGPGILPWLRDANLDIDVAPRPRGPAGNGGLALVSDTFKISSASANPEAAYLWIRYLTSDEGLAKMMTRASVFPARPDLQQRYFELNRDRLPENWIEFFNVITNPGTVGLFIHVDTAAVGQIEQEYLWELWRGNISVETGVQELDRRLNAILGSEAGR